jgi:uncharacterized protein YgiM (DUF1202 family)/outer membrane protein W
MRKKLILLGIIYIFSLTPVFANIPLQTDTTHLRKGKVIVDAAEIHLKPNIYSSVVLRVKRGAELTILGSEESGTWYSVRLYSEQQFTVVSGFIHSSLVEILPVEDEIQKKKKVLEELEMDRAEKEKKLAAELKKMAEEIKQEKTPEPPKEFEEKPTGKVRVINEIAFIRALSDPASRVISQTEAGTEFQIEQKAESWYRIKLPPNKDGIVLFGFIHESDVEELFEKVPLTPKTEEKEKIIDETEKIEEEEARKEEQPEEIYPLGIESDKNLSIGINGGYSHLLCSSYGGGLFFGGKVNFYFSRYFGFELNGFYLQGNVTGSSQGLSDGKLTLIPLQLSLTGRLAINEKIVVYVLGGGGININSFSLDPEIQNGWSDLDFEAIESVDNFVGFHFGAGIDYFIQENLALNFDVRYLINNTTGEWSLTDQISGISSSGSLEDLCLKSLVFGIGIKFFIVI